MNTIKRVISAALLITTAATNLAIAMDNDTLTTSTGVSTAVTAPVKPTTLSERVLNGIVPEWTDEFTAHGITKADYDVIKSSLDAKPYKNFSINFAEGVVEFYCNEPYSMVANFGDQIEEGKFLPSSTMTTHELKLFRRFNIHRTLRQYIETLKGESFTSVQTVVSTSPVVSDAMSSVVSDPLTGLRRDSSLEDVQRVLHITDLNPIGTKEVILIPTPTQTKARWEAMTDDERVAEATRKEQSTLESKSQRFLIDIQPDLIDRLKQLPRDYFYDPAAGFMARWAKDVYSSLLPVFYSDSEFFKWTAELYNREGAALQLIFSIKPMSLERSNDISKKLSKQLEVKFSDTERQDMNTWNRMHAIAENQRRAWNLLQTTLDTDRGSGSSK